MKEVGFLENMPKNQFPPALDGLICWLKDADKNVTGQKSDGVRVWKDQSGHGNDFIVKDYTNPAGE